MTYTVNTEDVYSHQCECIDIGVFCTLMLHTYSSTYPFIIQSNRVKRLRKKCKSYPPEFMAKLPKMAQQLELYIYSSASSFNEYRNEKTLIKRLQEGAIFLAEREEKIKFDDMSNKLYALHLSF